MNIKEKLGSIVEGFRTRFSKTFTRFITPSAYVIISSALLIYCVIADDIPEDTAFALMGLLVGLLCSLLMDLASEYRIIENIHRAVSALVSVLLSIGTFFVLKNFAEDSSYVLLGYIALVCVLFLLIIYVLYEQKNESDLFGYLFSSAFYSALLCSVILAGVSLCILAFQLLIYEFKDMYKLYLILCIVSEVTICSLLFMSYLPQKDSEMTVPKAYLVIINRVALIIYFALITILYLYLGKIIITRNMPKGQINWFASLATLGFCVFYLSCQGRRTSLEKFFMNYGGFIMIPILMMQAYAVYIRVSAYGLTSLRYLSLVFDLIGIGFIAAAILKTRVRLPILFMTVIVLLVLVGPLNVLDVPFRSQRGIFNDVLKRNNMLSADGKIIPSSTLSQEDQQKIRSTYDYMHYDSSTLSNPIKDIKYEDFESVFGFKYSEEYYNNTVYCSYGCDLEVIDVSSFNYVQPLRLHYDSQEQLESRLLEYLKALREEYGDYRRDLGDTELIYTFDDGKIYRLEEINFNVNDSGIITYITLYGYLLY